MGIGEIVAAIGGSAALFAFLGWATRSIILHLLAKDIEVFKAKLQMDYQRDMADFKSALEQAAFEYQTRFTRLHEKRAEIIGNLYGKIVDLHKAVSDFIRLFVSVNIPTKEKKLELLWKTADDFMNYFERHAIYFDKKSCACIDRFKEELSCACGILASFVKQREAVYVSDDDITGELKKAMGIMDAQIPYAKKDLENDFREILGVLQPMQASKVIYHGEHVTY